MSYSAIPWYILSAFLFFIPYAFMMSEYGAAFRKKSGGMFTNWDTTLSSKAVHLGNAPYIMMNNFGYQIALAVGAPKKRLLLLVIGWLVT